MSTAGDVTESRDDDVAAGRQCAAELGVEVRHLACKNVYRIKGYRLLWKIETSKFMDVGGEEK